MVTQLSARWKSVDHIAIAVADTEQALAIWRDKFGFPVLFQEKVAEGKVLLTHLDMGNVQLQLAEAFDGQHPLRKAVRAAGGDCLHHLCLLVDDVAEAAAELPELQLEPAPALHQGTLGKRALFLASSSTGNIQMELTGR